MFAKADAEARRVGRPAAPVFSYYDWKIMTPEPLHPMDPRRKLDKPERPSSRPGGAKAGRAGSGAPVYKWRKRKPKATDQGPPPGKVRIQKVLAEAGLASRRMCEQIVLEGRVSVNQETINELPCFVDPAKDEITLDGRSIRKKPEKKVYLLLNKPKGVVSTNADPKGRPRTIDLVAHVSQRVFPVGRLDAESTGLILMTNDGELANRVAHPRYGVMKTYIVEVEGRLDGEAMDLLKSGMFLDGRRTAGASVKVLDRSARRTIVEVRLNEGRNREIRRLMARMNHKVLSLRRVAIGPINDRGLKTGKSRILLPEEVEMLLLESEPGQQEEVLAPKSKIREPKIGIREVGVKHPEPGVKPRVRKPRNRAAEAMNRERKPGSK